MKPLPLILIAGGLMVPAVLAGPEQIIKQRAKDIRDQNNAAQGVPSRPANPPTSAQPAQKAQPAAQAVATPSQLSLNRFHADLAAIKQGSSLDAAQKQKMAANLSGAAAAKKPAANTVERFVISVHKAASAKPLPSAARARFIQDLDAILNPSKYPQAKPDAIFEDIRSIFVSNGSPTTEAADIAATARVLAADVK